MARVISYKVKWDLDTHSGQIEAKLWTPVPGNPHATTSVTLQPQDAAEMHLLVDLLRNESPVDYSTSTKEIKTVESETAGEGES